jgi:hypothetical protein
VAVRGAAWRGACAGIRLTHRVARTQCYPTVITDAAQRNTHVVRALIRACVSIDRSASRARARHAQMVLKLLSMVLVAAHWLGCIKYAVHDADGLERWCALFLRERCPPSRRRVCARHRSEVFVYDPLHEALMERYLVRFAARCALLSAARPGGAAVRRVDADRIGLGLRARDQRRVRVLGHLHVSGRAVHNVHHRCVACRALCVPPGPCCDEHALPGQVASGRSWKAVMCRSPRPLRSFSSSGEPGGTHTTGETLGLLSAPGAPDFARSTFSAEHKLDPELREECLKFFHFFVKSSGSYTEEMATFVAQVRVARRACVHSFASTPVLSRACAGRSSRPCCRRTWPSFATAARLSPPGVTTAAWALEARS